MIRLMTALGIAAVLSQCAASSSPLDPCSGPLFVQIFEDSSRANGVYGSQATVLIPGQAPWTGVYGWNESASPMRPELMIGTGSISKLFEVVAALRLVDRGVLSLDDTLGRWFPSTPNVNPAIPLRLVMQQTSGLADYMAAPNYFSIVMADPDRRWQPEELLPLVGPPLFAPGTGWNASNTNSLLLSIIVARKSGKPVGTFMREELWPGRTQSWFSAEGTAPGPLATQWAADAQGALYNYSAQYFGPALFTSRREVQASAGDIADFGQRLLGGDLLTPATRQAMLTIVPDDGKILGETGGGLGIRRYNYLGRTLYGHSGATPNSTALFLYDPATGVVAAVSVNTGGPSHGASHFRTTPALLQAAITCAGH